MHHLNVFRRKFNVFIENLTELPFHGIVIDRNYECFKFKLQKRRKKSGFSYFIKKNFVTISSKDAGEKYFLSSSQDSMNLVHNFYRPEILV
jgi:hypothetical protein